MAESLANDGGGDSPATDQKAVKGWLAQLALGNRLWIRSAVAAGTVAGIATIIQMVLLARIIHLGVIDEVPDTHWSKPGADADILAIVLFVIQSLGEQALFSWLTRECDRRIRVLLRLLENQQKQMEIEQKQSEIEQLQEEIQQLFD